MSTKRRPRVFLVDDHGLFRTGVRAELGELVEVIGEADDVEPAIELISERLPDVVLLDVHLPGGGGQHVVREVLDQGLDVKFLALSVSDAPEDVIAVIRAGARGYVTKTISGTELIEAIVRVAEGDAVFSPRLAGFVLDAFASGGAIDPGVVGVIDPSGGPSGPGGLVGPGGLGSPGAAGAAGAAPWAMTPPPGRLRFDPELDQLTPREQEVLRLIARGYTYKELARELSISTKTVESHVSAVLRKLQLSTRHQLTRWATERRLV
ncbi:MAG: response regulator [Acidimicrobiales bacterium]